jgi:hypothetical protein
LIGKHLFLGNHEKEMVFQVSSQSNFHLISNLTLGKDIRDLKVDLIILAISLIDILIIFAAI